MGKSLILFLSFMLLACLSDCQNAAKTKKCNCDDKMVQDSLITHYIENGAQKTSYNEPIWQTFCDSLVVICPNIAISYQQKAIPFIKNGDYAKAFVLEDKAVELDAKQFMGYRGFLKCILLKDYEGSLPDFEEAQKLIPNNYEMDHLYFFYEGICYLGLKNYSLAEKEFNQDIFVQTGGDTLKKAHFNTLFYTGVLYYEMNNYEKAKKQLLKCLSVYPQHPDANYYLALIYKREGNTALAKQYLQAARQALSQGYDMNEDNDYYANYPFTIKTFEVDRELSKL